MYLLLIDEKWWAKTDGIHARLIQDPAYLEALNNTGKFPVVKISNNQFRANYIEIDADVLKTPGRVRTILDIATGSPGMPDWARKASLFNRILEKLGAA